MKDCQNCNLCKTRKNIVIGKGSKHPKILFIGEAPGKEEDLQGIPFVGASGELLEQWIAFLGFNKEECAFINVMKCFPHNGDFIPRKPTTEEMVACSPWLLKQIEDLKPQLIFLLGKTALESFIPHKGILKSSGQYLENQGKKYFCMVHPSYCLRNPNYDWISDLMNFKQGSNNDYKLVIDIETTIEENIEDGKPLLFGAYSYKTKEYYSIPFKERDKIQKLMREHRYLIGYNIKYFDLRIMAKFGIHANSNFCIDLYEIMKTRAPLFKDKIKSFKLDAICKMFGIVGKTHIDFGKASDEELAIYNKNDVEITKALFEKLDDMFGSLKEYLNLEQKREYGHLLYSTGSFAYKAICNLTGIKEEYAEGAEGAYYEGGFVAKPSMEVCKGNVICCDFGCLPENTIIKTIKNKKYKWKKSENISYRTASTNIQDIKIGDRIINKDGIQYISDIRSKFIDEEILEIELENGLKICCTDEHKFPILTDTRNILVKEGINLNIGEEMITRISHYGKQNSNYKTGQCFKEKEIICPICKKTFITNKVKKTCSKQCMNKAKARIKENNGNWGKNKYNTSYLQKMSLERKNKKRSQIIKEHISFGTIQAMKREDVYNKFIEGNLKRDKTFFHKISWLEKVHNTMRFNIKNGKFKYNNICFRSSWEIEFAKKLEEHNIRWIYEPNVFDLGNNIFYIPDFYLPEFNIYVEIKGYKSVKSMHKIELFRKKQ